MISFRTAILACAFILQSVAATTAIKIDQAGYLPNAPKYAMVVRAGGPAQNSQFFVRRARDDSTAFSGTLARAVFDPGTGDNLELAEFSELKENGAFYLEVPGTGKSWRFNISPDVFRHVYYLTARSYYGQRCGTAVDLGPEFATYKHAACHLAGGYDRSAGKTGDHVSSYGWHDAGDYGRYVVNSGVSTGTLLWAYELFGDRVKNISLNLPESGNHVSDLLNQIRWNIEWTLTMQDTDGGVWHKQTSAHFCGFVVPERDQMPSLVIGTGAPPYKS